MKKPYDKNKIGKFIGWGGEHLVYEYEKDKVIKFSLHVCLSGKSAVDKIRRDYHDGLKYFSGYILPTDILTWSDGKKCAEIQKKIECRFLRRNDLQNPLINEQFFDIMQRHQIMENETNEVFDLLGREGLFKFKLNFISNILVTSGNKLILIDFTILNLHPLKLREWPLWLIITWAKHRQKKLLSDFIK